MSPSLFAALRPSGRGLRGRLVTLLMAVALGAAGLLALPGPAYADANIQIADSADPVAVGTPYTYTVTVPLLDQSNFSAYAVITQLSGAAATFTSAVTDDSQGGCGLQNSDTQVSCTGPGFGGTATHVTLTLTVLPTAEGTVTADTELIGQISGTDSTTTTIAAVSSAADIAVAVTGQPHLGVLVPYLRYTLTAHNTGPDAVTSATVTASLPPGASATGLSSGCTTGAGTVTCAYGAIANGASADKSFRVPLHLLSLGQKSVTGTRTASSPDDPGTANDSDTATCTVVSVILATCP
ncbi:hypothetical protein ABT185_36655 [Streptomyces clavifer]|uniref:hypothetical protein n=1 Tax=Streptomyces clavifer TaxID=68188 RepID=UPI00333400E7